MKNVGTDADVAGLKARLESPLHVLKESRHERRSFLPLKG